MLEDTLAVSRNGTPMGSGTQHAAPRPAPGRAAGRWAPGARPKNTCRGFIPVTSELETTQILRRGVATDVQKKVHSNFIHPRMSTNQQCIQSMGRRSATLKGLCYRQQHACISQARCGESI